MNATGPPAAPEGPTTPPALRPGDRIGVAAPAGPFSRDRFQAGVDLLRQWGHDLLLPDEIYQADGFLAGPDHVRAEVFNRLIADRRVKAIIAARGGHGSLRLLDRVDYPGLSLHPKMIIGFSDLTALLTEIHARTGLTVFHGPVVTQLPLLDAESQDHFQRLIAGRPAFPLDLSGARAIVPGRARGRLLGGNMTLILHLAAAGRLPDLTGALLFLEDVFEAPYRLDRILTALRLSGRLDGLAGLILGRFVDCGPAEEVERVLMDQLQDRPYPVVADFPSGHGPQHRCLPLGPEAILDADAGVFDMAEPYLE